MYCLTVYLFQYYNLPCVTHSACVMYTSFVCNVLVHYPVACVRIQVSIPIQFFTIVFRGSVHSILIITLRKGGLHGLYGSAVTTLTLYA